MELVLFTILKKGKNLICTVHTYVRVHGAKKFDQYIVNTFLNDIIHVTLQIIFLHVPKPRHMNFLKIPK